MKKVWMLRCPQCRRLRKYGTWVTLRDLDDQEYQHFRRLYYDGRIDFTDMTCSVCRPSPALDLEPQEESAKFAHA